MKAFEAFRSRPVVEGLSGKKVECLCWWHDSLLAGLQDGTVVLFKNVLDPVQGEQKWQIAKVHRSIDRRGFIQMVAITSRPLLVSLTDEGANLHTLPDMNLKCQALRSKGGSAMAWSEEKQQLAVAVRRKVILYQLSGSDFVEVSEAAVSDVAVCMLWLGEQLVLGTKRAYMVLSSVSPAGTCTEVCSTGSAPTPIIQPVPSSREVLLLRDNTSYFYDTAPSASASDAGGAGQQQQQRLPLAPSRRKHLTWSGPVMGLAASEHYALGLVPSGVEVRSLRRVADVRVLQLLALPDAHTVTATPAGDGSLFVACGQDQSVRQLLPVPLEEQAHTLADLGDYQEALAMAQLLEEAQGQQEQERGGSHSSKGGNQSSSVNGSEQAADRHRPVASPSSSSGPGGGQLARPRVSRQQLEEQLRLAYGHHLFASGEFDEGMAQLALCRATNALVLLRLLPSLVPDKWRYALPGAAAGKSLPEVHEPQGEAFNTAAALLLPYLLSHRTRVLAALATQQQQQQQQQAGASSRSLSSQGTTNSINGHAYDDNAAGALSSPGRDIADDYVMHGDLHRAVSHAHASSSASSATQDPHGMRVKWRRGQRGSAGSGTRAQATKAPAPGSAAASHEADDTSSASSGSDSDGGSGQQQASTRAVRRPAGAAARHATAAGDGGAASATSSSTITTGLRGRPPTVVLEGVAEGQDESDTEGSEAAAQRVLLGGLSPTQLLAIIDTAIVSVMVVMPDTGALLRFVQLPNHVDLEEGEKVLSQSAMYAELAALYKYNGCHDQGMSLLKRLSQEPGSFEVKPRGAAADLPGLPGVWAAVRYLVSLTEAHAPVIQEHAGWVLAADPEAGLTAFLQMRPPLNPSLVLSILAQHSRHYCAMYLEAALQMGVALPQDYHSELLLLYLADLLGQQQQQQQQAAAKRMPAAMTPPTHIRSQLASGSPNVVGSPANLAGPYSLKQLLMSSPDVVKGQPPPKLFPDDQHASHHVRSAVARRSASAPTSHGTTPSTSRIPSATNLTALAADSGAGDPDQGHGRGSQAADATSTPGGQPPPRTSFAAQGSSTYSEPTLYQRLRDLVYTSPYIDPNYVLSKLPAGQLLEIRALMLERLGRHREALRLYVHAMRDLDQAEAYCDRVYDAAATAAAATAAASIGSSGGSSGGVAPGGNSSFHAGSHAGPAPAPASDVPLVSRLSSPGQVYLELLQAIYDGPTSVDLGGGPGGMDMGTGSSSGGASAHGTWSAAPKGMLVGLPHQSHPQQDASALDPASWQALSLLLARKRGRVDWLDVLATLPGDVSVADVMSVIGGSLRHVVEERRNLAVLRQLRRCENLAAREELVHAQRQRVLVTAERACSLCFKRIGSAVFVAYPSGKLAHYLCFKRA